MIQCKKCGDWSEEGSKFCQNCGCNFEDVELEIQNLKKSKRYIIGGISISVLLLLGIILFVDGNEKVDTYRDELQANLNGESESAKRTKEALVSGDTSDSKVTEDDTDYGDELADYIEDNYESSGNEYEDAFVDGFLEGLRDDDADATTGQKNAKSRAKEYIEEFDLSSNALVLVLKAQGFTDEDCKYAVDNCGKDWSSYTGGEWSQSNVNAVLVALEEFEWRLMSRSEMYDNLVDWYDIPSSDAEFVSQRYLKSDSDCIERAKNSLSYDNSSRTEVISDLQEDGYTQEEIDTALKAIGY